MHAGEVVGLVGPNGAGKSTLLALLAGALPPTTGDVASGTPEPRVGWAPQRPAQYGHLSARENLELFARLQGVDDPVGQAQGLIDLLALPERRSTQLSVGNQQRLNLALALLGDPDVLLLDEPTASLDPASRTSLWAIVARLRARSGTTVFATHAVEEVERFATRAVVLLDGQVRFDGKPSDVEAALPEPAIT
ncbi:MAG: ABC transporter ATP-binding protein [Thermoleophilia bacterium]|nr:ABC transporter ATP-binding protein [Thermoleophilia bacterium]MDH5332917.1 ABC transporter ATP-binding protein [Thermoleophilia bacterium]